MAGVSPMVRKVCNTIFRNNNSRLTHLQLIARLWSAIEADSDSEQYKCFLRFLDSEISKLHRHRASFALHDPEQLAQAISRLRASPSLTREIATDIVSHFSTPIPAKLRDHDWKNALSRSVEMTLAILTTVQIQIPRQIRDEVSEPTTILWTDETATVQALISHFFESKKNSLGSMSSRQSDLSKLTMDHLSNSYGYQPVWTNNLAEHLRIDHKLRRVMVYEHKICLWNHYRLSHQGPGGSVPILPIAVVAEALDTLNLLFPWGQETSKSFLRRHGKPFYGLGTCGRELQHDLSQYYYWQRELAELAEITSCPPRGKAQFILDKDGTNSMQFWTFWTAMAFGVLAIIGVATGIYAAVYAKLAYDVGVLQYQLALAQACSADNATDVLPGFCQ